MELLFWICCALIVWVYAGYPAFLWCCARWWRAVSAHRGEIEPRVTLIISAYNEAGVIRKKLENSLALAYPRDKSEILVVSDASSDATDGIVNEYQSRGVRLLRMAQRGGKTLGLNEAVKNAAGDIVIFSDANAMYDAQVVRMFVRNFADPAVGCVTGESRYNVHEASDSANSENLYWRYELAIKRLESQVGSLVGGDGAIYAIRKQLYRPMQASDLSDFVNPLQIAAQHYRNVYEPEAICYEDGAESFDKEFQRKVRIVNRAWRGLWRVRQVMNPLRYGFFALEIWSHKLLRWLVPIFMALALASNLVLLQRAPLYLALGTAHLGFYAMAAIGWLRSQQPAISRLFYVPYYFCMVNYASLLGILHNYRGETFTMWQTVRE